MSTNHGFKIGQVVNVDGRAFGEITKFLSGDEAEIRFWDFDNGDYWSWMYPLRDLKPLTKPQRGAEPKR